jgi:hypothetical protein
MELKDVFTHEDLSIGSYRFAVSKMIPQMAQIALRTHKKDITKEKPDFAKKEFLYPLSRSDYEKEWGKDYSKPASERAWPPRFCDTCRKLDPSKPWPSTTPPRRPKIVLQEHQ